MKNSLFIRSHKTIPFRKVFVSTAAFKFGPAILHSQKTVVTGATLSMAASWASGIKLGEFVHYHFYHPQDSCPTGQTENCAYTAPKYAEVFAKKQTTYGGACDKSDEIEQFNGIHILRSRLKPICYPIYARICPLGSPVQKVSSAGRESCSDCCAVCCSYLRSQKCVERITTIERFSNNLSFFNLTQSRKTQFVIGCSGQCLRANFVEDWVCSIRPKLAECRR